MKDKVSNKILVNIILILMVVMLSMSFYKKYINGNNKNISNTKNYEIIENVQLDKNYKEKGFLIENKKKKTTVTITSGEKNTGGYNIVVTNIDIRGNKANIYVNETKPSKNDITTQALTYPSIQVIFKRDIKKVNVIDYKTNKKYSEIKNK